VARPVPADLPAGEQGHAAGRLLRPEQGQGQLGAARSDQAGEAHDLAAPDGQVDPGYLLADVPVLDIQDHVSGGYLALGVELRQVAAHHHPDHVLPG
jgi:hypothetical protein